jgi:peptidoglycan/LPS O-acetylase OafA/YrhL
MVFVFLLGATAHLYAHRVPMSGWLALAAAVLFLVSVFTLDNYRLVGGVPLSYLLLWVSACFPWPVSLPADLSYGVYIYHWPILQLIAATGLVELSGAAFFTLGLLGVLPVAALSWFLIEKPALARKHSPLPDRVESSVRRAWTAARRQPEPAQRRP